MKVLENLKYSNDHEWIKVEGDEAYVGITDFAQNELGEIVFIDITSSNEEDVELGDVFGSIEAVKTVSDLFMPISGTIIQKNDNLDATPEFINSDPYGEGWIVKIKIKDKNELNELMDAEEYKEFIGK